MEVEIAQPPTGSTKRQSSDESQNSRLDLATKSNVWFPNEAGWSNARCNDASCTSENVALLENIESRDVRTARAMQMQKWKNRICTALSLLESREMQ